MRTLSTFAALFLVVSACATESIDPDTGTLEIEVMTDRELRGTYTWGESVLTFRAEELVPKVWVSHLEIHGMMLEATMSRQDGLVIQWDGYAAHDGADTQLIENDRLAIAMFVKKLEAEHPEIGRNGGAPQSFDEVANKWAEWIPAMALTQHEIHDTTRGGNICSAATCLNGSYTGCCNDRWTVGWHDCSTCSWDNRCSNYVQLGDHCTCADDAWVWNGSSWVCQDNGHATYSDGTRRHAVGNCYGRYGDGCGSGRSYNWASLDHDNCARNGHVVASGWCSDELFDTHSDGNCY